MLERAFANQKAPPMSFYWSQLKNLDQEINWLRRSDPSFCHSQSNRKAEEALNTARETQRCFALISKRPVVRMTWEAIHRGMNLTLEESTLLGADYFGLVASTEDFRAGTRSFLEKTSPSFRGG
jgi:enoyl-CoA hydratase/carnithine racemase